MEIVVLFIKIIKKKPQHSCNNCNSNSILVVLKYSQNNVTFVFISTSFRETLLRFQNALVLPTPRFSPECNLKLEHLHLTLPLSFHIPCGRNHDNQQQTMAPLFFQLPEFQEMNRGHLPAGIPTTVPQQKYSTHDVSPWIHSVCPPTISSFFICLYCQFFFFIIHRKGGSPISPMTSSPVCRKRLHS